MADIKLAKQRRAQIKGQLTRMQHYFENEEVLSLADAQVRIERLKEVWSQFERLQTQIEDSIEQQDEQFEEIEREIAERAVFENSYFKVAAMAQAVIEANNKEQKDQLQAQIREQLQAQLQVQERIQAVNPAAEQNIEARDILLDNRRYQNRKKLPDIKLPEFHGEYTKWMFFRNNFESTIHQDPFLTPMEKHQYLIGVLKGEALQVVQGFDISNENYDNAWQLLKDTYDNQMIIIETHLDELFQFPSIEKENKADSIRKLVWHIRTHLKSLEALQQPVAQWDTIIIHLAKKKLEFVEQRDWQNLVKNKTPQDMPKLEEFLKFLTERCHNLRLLSQNKEKVVKTKQMPVKKEGKRINLIATTSSCAICEQNHPVFRCETWLKGSTQERRDMIKEKNLCLNCLRSGHYVYQCKAPACKKCSKKHNTLLHYEDNQLAVDESKVSIRTSSTDQANKKQEGTSVGICHMQKSTSKVILSTAMVYIIDSNGNKHKCRALLDPGSQSNIATEKLIQRCNLKYRLQNQSISGISRTTTNATKLCDLQIQSRNERLPQQEIDVAKMKISKDITLADPDFSQPGDIDLLIGAGLYWRLLLGAPRNRCTDQPAMQNTKLGWIIGGDIPGDTKNSIATCLTVTNELLSQQLEKFWIQEGIPEVPLYTIEEIQCEDYFKETIERDATGRFIVRLPMRAEVTLGNSRDQAVKRFLSLERRFKRDADLKNAYIDFIQEYIRLGHMSQVFDDDKQKDSEEFILPHQAVLRPSSTTTKLRVVFDGSAKTTLGTTLNDKLMTGPNLQRDLTNIILRFRLHEYVITADVTMMFRQIWVDKKDRAYQRIVWRSDPGESIKIYELNTVTYGTASAPYLAMKCLRRLAELHGVEFPKAAKAVIEDCYMDDIQTGADTIEETKQLQEQLSALFMRGQFPLRKWRSNNPEILQHLAEQCKTEQLFILDKDESIKTLGVYWNAALDLLQYQVEFPKISVNTKRVILSKIARVFDPLGIISPIIIRGKMIMQQLWEHSIEWDQPIPEPIMSEWNAYYADLQEIGTLQIPRRINYGGSSNLTIAGFGDASEKAYGACLYGLSEDRDGNMHSHLIVAKSRVAPLKKTTLPRLELEAAVLLSQLYNVIRQAYGDRIGNVTLWSDSTIVLAWLKRKPNELKTYVANRVSKIQDLTQNISWNHVQSEENPADLVSRGVSIQALINHKLWWQGPNWLTSERKRQANIVDLPQDLPELKSTKLILTVTQACDILRRFQRFEKLLRVIAYVRRFIKFITRGEKTIGPISVNELTNAEMNVIRMTQKEDFSKELQEIKRGLELHHKSKLKALDPFIDDEGILRVGGRLRHSDIPTDHKHPIILPDKHYITRLIMKEQHERLHHCPPEQLLSVVRCRYWPLCGHRESKKIIKRCLSCFRFRPTIIDVKMGDLPKQRVQGLSRAFTSSGVDYAGPLQVKESRRRGRIHISKGYVAVFTCLSTKAMHLELVSDLTAEAFLAALSRFTARRGICLEMFSDNGTNFVGAARELKEIYAFLEKEQENIKTSLARQRIDWNFIPPRAPHFGGLWEAAVKMMKRHLYTVTKGRVLTFEEYSTLLAEIEAVLNSRPLTPLSDDPLDLSVLTPAHFLINDSLIQPVQYNLLSTPENRLSRWQRIQSMRQQFWHRWSSEYLQELQKRTKWTSSSNNINLGTLVLIREDQLPPLQWLLGRVCKLYPGADGITRVVSVKTQNGEFKRAVKKLCPLPIDCDK